MILICQAVTVKESEACPVIAPDCLEENIKLDQTGCCKICTSCKDSNNRTRQVGEAWTRDKCSTCSCLGKFPPYKLFIFVI